MKTNQDVVRGIYADFGRGDLAAVLAAFDPHITWNEAENFIYADGNPYRGPAAVATGVFQRIGEAFADFAAVPQSFIDAGSVVIALGRYQGRGRATGAALDAQFAHIWHLEKGKISRFQQYTDTRQWARVAGL